MSVFVADVTTNSSDVMDQTSSSPTQDSKDDYMPAEYLVSDDSDVAGQYNVSHSQASQSTATAASSSSSYHRLYLSSHSSSR